MQPETSKTDANGKQQEASPPQWKESLNGYWNEELKGLTFASDKDMDAALDLLDDRRLGKIPFELAFGDSIVVPAEAVHFFTEAGLQFTLHDIIDRSQLTEEEREEYRKDRRY